jgi:hypothetical protein
LSISLSPGTHDVIAEYSGDPNFNPSTSVSERVTVTAAQLKLDTMTSLSGISQSTDPTKPTTFQAVVLSSQGFASGGTVTFLDNGAPVGVVPLSGASATFAFVLAPGTHRLTAVYSGTNNFNGSTSAPMTLTIALPTRGDVSTLVVVNRAKVRLNKKTKRYEQPVTITNGTGQVLQGPLTLILQGLRSDIKLVGAAGFVGSKKRRSPFVRVVLHDNNLMLPGASLTLKLVFRTVPNRYTPVLMAG